MNVSEELADITHRNAGHPCLTIWKDGSFVHHGYRDAEIAALSEPDDVLLTIRLDTLDAVTFITPQQRIALAEKFFGSRRT